MNRKSNNLIFNHIFSILPLYIIYYFFMQKNNRVNPYIIHDEALIFQTNKILNEIFPFLVFPRTKYKSAPILLNEK